MEGASVDAVNVGQLLLRFGATNVDIDLEHSAETRDYSVYSGVDISFSMTDESFQHLGNVLDSHERTLMEEDLRKKHVSLDEAYQQYKLLLKLYGGDA